MGSGDVFIRSSGAAWLIWSAVWGRTGPKRGPEFMLLGTMWENYENMISVLKTSISHYIYYKTIVLGESRKKKRNDAKRGPKTIKIEVKHFRNHFGKIWGRFGGSWNLEGFWDENSGPKMNKIGNLRPEGGRGCILGSALAECMDPAEALKLASSSVDVRSARFVSRGGGAADLIQVASGPSPPPPHFVSSRSMIS